MLLICGSGHKNVSRPTLLISGYFVRRSSRNFEICKELLLVSTIQCNTCSMTLRDFDCVHLLFQSEFQDSVLDTDMFLYLSTDWLSHVYQTVLSKDMLAQTYCVLDDNMSLFTVLKGKQ